jgi:hypothetical protein
LALAALLVVTAPQAVMALSLSLHIFKVAALLVPKVP